MKYLLVCTFSVLITGVAFAQESEGYVIPFASTGNTIELSIENTSQTKSSNISVEIKEYPSWITFAGQRVSIPELPEKSEPSALFSFSIDKSAPIGKKETLTFMVSSANGQTWTKQISIQAGPPETFELFQNYPNPFNPSTTIGYLLPADSRVQLKIYNMLGQEVFTVVDADRPAGFHQEVWNASSVSSGIYVYRMIAIDASGKEVVEKKMMTLIK